MRRNEERERVKEGKELKNGRSDGRERVQEGKE